MHPPVIMIHGAFCGGWAFDKFRAAFAEAGYPSAAPTLRYHDRGDDPPAALGKTSMLDYVQDIEAELAALKEMPVLLGHSMGGLLAQMLAARAAVRAIILLSPSAPWGVLPSTMFEFASANAMFLAGDFWNKPLQPNYEIATANALDRLPKRERDTVFERFVPESGLATFEIMHWALDARRATRVDAWDITCPVLCLSGTEDRVNPPPTVRRVAQRYRGLSTYAELDAYSHWMVGEPGWEHVAARAIGWLDDILKRDVEVDD